MILVKFITVIQHGLFVTQGTHDLSPECERWYCKVVNGNKRYVNRPVFNSTSLIAYHSIANLGKILVKFGMACLCRGENAVLICESAAVKPR